MTVLTAPDRPAVALVCVRQLRNTLPAGPTDCFGHGQGRCATRPMTLGSMRRNGVRGLFVTCQHCVHYAKVNVDAWPDDVLALSLGPRTRCSKCGKLGAMVEGGLERAGRSMANTRPAVERAVYGRLAPPGSPGRYCRYGKTTTAGKARGTAERGGSDTARGVRLGRGRVRAASRRNVSCRIVQAWTPDRQLREIQ